MNNNPIGIFDSGVGGLSVWKELVKILPNESIIYYADSANCPYGTKTQAEIIHLSQRIVEFFIQQNVKLIIVACNTATAASIDFLRKYYTIPFVGMEPAVKPAALKTKKGIVGILATEGTFNGRLFNETTEKWASNIQVEIQVGKGFVELVERGDFYSDKAISTVKTVLQPLLDKGIDQLVLACTHYPFLYESIREVSKDIQLEIINPAPAVVKQTQNLLKDNNALANKEQIAEHHFYSSGSLETMQEIVKKINPNLSASFQTKQL